MIALFLDDRIGACDTCSSKLTQPARLFRHAFFRCNFSDALQIQFNHHPKSLNRGAACKVGGFFAGSAAANGHAGDDSQHSLQGLAAARAAMADGGEEAAPQPDDDDDELFRVNTTARGADAGAAGEAEAAAVLRPESSAAAVASGILNFLFWHGKAQPIF